MLACITRNKKTRTHYLVRAVPADVARRESFEPDPSALNALLAVKAPGALVQIVDGLPPIVAVESLAGIPRMLAPADAAKLLSAAFTACDADALAAELFLDSAEGLRANGLALGKFVEKYCCDGAGAAERMGSLSDEFTVLVEPVQDWMAVRNQLSTALRLKGLMEGGEPEIFAKAGFERVDNKRIGAPLLVIPAKFNPFFAKPAKSAAEDAASDPLFSAMAPKARRATSIPGVGDITPSYPDPRNGSVFFTTKTLATDDLPSWGSLFRPNRVPAEDRTLYLCVEDSGDQGAMARSVVESFSYEYVNLDLEGEKAGWEYDVSGEHENIDAPRILCRSFASALWYALSYHEGKRITVCRLCGNAVLSNERGTRKDYCSDACRVRDANRRKAAGADGADPA